MADWNAESSAVASLVERPQLDLASKIRRLVIGLRARRARTFGEVVTALDDGDAISLTLLFLALLAIVPTPGLPVGTVVGLALLLVALNLAVGSDRLLLPGWLARRPLPRRHLVPLARAAIRRLRQLEPWVRPRLRGLTSQSGRRTLAVPVLLFGLVIALPIPFGNTLPGLAVLFMALGLAARDGAVIVAGLTIGIAGVGLPLMALLLAIRFVPL